MWQRIQTLYIAVATILIGALFFCTFAKYFTPDGIETISYCKFTRPFFLILLIIVFLINLFAVGLFKIRLFQMRVCVLATFVLLGMQIWLGVYVVMYLKQVSFSITAVFPIVAAILDVLASRAIMLDEAKVR
ncbi:MAG: DUF4293 domain-containing protein, partial [Bacteroidales bacterium]|nr:DUF4293 domain-containing protein [Bacteroidales bacterium]